MHHIKGGLLFMSCLCALSHTQPAGGCEAASPYECVTSPSLPAIVPVSSWHLLPEELSGISTLPAVLRYLECILWRWTMHRQLLRSEKVAASTSSNMLTLFWIHLCVLKPLPAWHFDWGPWNFMVFYVLRDTSYWMPAHWFITCSKFIWMEKLNPSNYFKFS